MRGAAENRQRSAILNGLSSSIGTAALVVESQCFFHQFRLRSLIVKTQNKATAM